MNFLLFLNVSIEVENIMETPLDFFFNFFICLTFLLLGWPTPIMACYLTCKLPLCRYFSTLSAIASYKESD